MNRVSIALTVSASLLAGALAGCGGGSGRDTSSVAGSGHAAACTGVRAANARYRAAIAAQGLKFTDAKFEQRTIEAITAYRSSVLELATATSGPEQQQVTQLAEGLARQRVVVSALAKHDLAAIREFGPGLNTLLYEGQKNLSKICPGVPSTIFHIG